MSTLKIDISWALAFFFAALFLLIAVSWIRIFLQKERGLLDIVSRSTFLIRCPYCGFVYFDYKNAVEKKCPRCQSYLGVGEDRNEDKDK